MLSEVLKMRYKTRRATEANTTLNDKVTDKWTSKLQVETYLPPIRNTNVRVHFVFLPICNRQTSRIGNAPVTKSKMILGIVIPNIESVRVDASARY